jgi:glucan phosphorylase
VEFERHKTRYTVRFGGRIQQEGKHSCWLETEEIIAVAFDQMIPGYETDATNTLRLWSTQASKEINLGKFNQGDYFAAAEDKSHSENVSRVLYRTTRPVQGVNFDFVRSISSPPPQCRIFSPAITSYIRLMTT